MCDAKEDAHKDGRKRGAKGAMRRERKMCEVWAREEGLRTDGRQDGDEGANAHKKELKVRELGAELGARRCYGAAGDEQHDTKKYEA